MKLAIKGGTPLRQAGWPVWPQINPDMEGALKKILESGEWGVQNPITKELEAEWADICDAKHALTNCNGTISLEIILRALDIGRGDEVIIPIYTFAATATAVIAVGATPVFVDIESDSYQISAESVEANITPLTKAVIGVHVGGCPCDIEKIAAVAEKHGIYFIEDSAQAHGASWKNKGVGSHGVAGSFSFQASKNISGGEAGIVTTNSTELFNKMKAIRKNSNAYVSINGRLSAWQSAMLFAQLGTLDEFLSRRMENAAYLDSLLNKFDFVKPIKINPKVTKNAYHLYMFKFFSEKCEGISRSAFLAALSAEGIYATCGYSEMINTMGIFNSPYFYKTTGTKRSYNEDKLQLSEGKKAAYEQGCWMYMNHLMGTKKDIDDIANAIEKIYVNAKYLTGEEKK